MVVVGAGGVTDWRSVQQTADNTRFRPPEPEALVLLDQRPPSRSSGPLPLPRLCTTLRPFSASLPSPTPRAPSLSHSLSSVWQ